MPSSNQTGNDMGRKDIKFEGSKVEASQNGNDMGRNASSVAGIVSAQSTDTKSVAARGEVHPHLKDMYRG